MMTSSSSPTVSRKASSHRLPSFASPDEMSTTTTESSNSKSAKYGRVNVVQEAKQELEDLKKCMRRDNSKVLKRVKSGPSDFVVNAKLGSIDQIRDDLRCDQIESWCKSRAKAEPSHLSMSEKRALRKWFLKMDADGSGEVGVDELQDPLLSSGVVKSRSDIEHMLRSVVMNENNEVTFDNFLKAINNSKYCKKDKIKNLQVMSSNQNFAMETLLSQERRRILLKGIVDDATERQQQLEMLLNDSGDGSQKISKKMKESIIRDHEDQVNDHNDFVHALEQVLADKFRLLRHRNESVNGANSRARRQKVTAGFSFSKDGDSNGGDLKKQTTQRLLVLEQGDRII